MKNKKWKVTLLGALLMLAVASGCGDLDKTLTSAPVGGAGEAEEESEGSGIDNNADKQAGQGDKVEAENGSGSQDAERSGQESQPEGEADNTDRDLETLYGNVKSVEEGSFVVSQAFEEGENMLVSPGDGSEDETLVTVYVSENTQYEVETVKNGGVNGDADVEKSSGSFADLSEDVSVELAGYYEGEDFHAEHIFVMKFL